MGRYQIVERVDLGKPLGAVDPRAHGSKALVVELSEEVGDRLVKFGAAVTTKAAVTYPKPAEPAEPDPDSKPKTSRRKAKGDAKEDGDGGDG